MTSDLTTEYFYSGNKAKCNYGKYKGQSVIVDHWAGNAGPDYYVCKTLDGVDILLNADKHELVSLYRFDMEMIKDI